MPPSRRRVPPRSHGRSGRGAPPRPRRLCPAAQQGSARGATRAAAAGRAESFAAGLPRRPPPPAPKPAAFASPLSGRAGSCAVSRDGRRGGGGRGSASPQHPSRRGPAAGHGAFLQEKNGNKEFTDVGLSCRSPPPPRSVGTHLCRRAASTFAAAAWIRRQLVTVGSAVFLHTCTYIHTHTYARIFPPHLGRTLLRGEGAASGEPTAAARRGSHGGGCGGERT